MRWDIGVDLGSESIRIAQYRMGATFSAASRVAMFEGKDKMLCCGDRAWRLEGHSCKGIKVFSPICDGTLENKQYAQWLMHWAFLQSETVNRSRKFGVMLGCAPQTRPVQRRALIEAAIDAGAADAIAVRSDVAAALGAGIDIFAPEAKLLVCVGAGNISASLFSFGHIVNSASLPYGLQRIDIRIQNLLRSEQGKRIGLQSAKEIKHTIGSALPIKSSNEVIMHMTGFDRKTALPQKFDVEAGFVQTACEDVVREIVNLCAAVITEAPEELSADLNDAGAVLCGGGAELSGLDKRLSDELKLPFKIADTSATCCIRGIFELMRSPERCPAAFF